jgi:hypothetical protein
MEYAKPFYTNQKKINLASNHGIFSTNSFQGAHYVDVTLTNNFLATALCELVDFVCICKDMFNFYNVYNVSGKISPPDDIKKHILNYTNNGVSTPVTGLFDKNALFSQERIKEIILLCYDDNNEFEKAPVKNLSDILFAIMNHLQNTEEITPIKDDSQFTKFSGGKDADINNLRIIKDMFEKNQEAEEALAYFYPNEDDEDEPDTSENIRAANAVAALIHAPQRNIVSKFVIEQFRIAQQALKEDLRNMQVLGMPQTAGTLGVSGGSGEPGGSGGSGGSGGPGASGGSGGSGGPGASGGTRQFATLDIASLPFSFLQNK